MIKKAAQGNVDKRCTHDSYYSHEDVSEHTIGMFGYTVLQAYPENQSVFISVNLEKLPNLYFP